MTDTPFAAFIGLDWADQRHALALQPADGGNIEHDQIEQTPEALDQWAMALHARFHGRPMAIALEQARGALIYALMKYPHLVLYPVPPARLANYRKAFATSGAKDDPTDAQLILDYLLKHRDQLRPWKADAPQTRQLTLLVEQRRKFVQTRTKLTQQLIACLKICFPQALNVLGAHMYTRLVCDFLIKWPDLAAAQRARTQTLRQFYYGHNIRRGDVVEQRLQTIRQAKALIEDEAILQVMRQTVKELARLLRRLVDTLAGFERRIEELFKTHPDAALFATLPGAGQALAPRLLVAFGSDRDRFADARQIQTFTGIAPVTQRSGRQCLVLRRWACPKFLHQTFHEFALHSIGFSVWAKAYHQTQLARGNGHHAAVRALAFKWIRILFVCWRDRIPYDEARYLAQLKKRGSPLFRQINPTSPCRKNGKSKPKMT